MKQEEDEFILEKGGKLYSTVSNYGDKKNKRKNKIEKFNNA